MFFQLLSDGFRDGLYWLPFVLGVGLLYKNMKTIDISIDGISVISIIAFVATWRWLQTAEFFYSSPTISLLLSALTSICCAAVCYSLLFVLIHKLRINSIFAGIIFSFVLYAISVLAIGESLSLRPLIIISISTILPKFSPICHYHWPSQLRYFSEQN